MLVQVLLREGLHQLDAPIHQLPVIAHHGEMACQLTIDKGGLRPWSMPVVLRLLVWQCVWPVSHAGGQESQFTLNPTLGVVLPAALGCTILTEQAS